MYQLLVVDDESIIRRGIRAFIDFDGLGISRLFEAENGEEAIAILEKEQIDLILADINMPKMDGLEFCRRAKERDPSVKAAVITGYDYLDYAIRAIKVGGGRLCVKAALPGRYPDASFPSGGEKERSGQSGGCAAGSK